MVRKRKYLTPIFCFVLLIFSCSKQVDTIDILLLNGNIYDGSGAQPFVADIGIQGDSITFIGDAESADIRAGETISVTGLMVTPGFIDMHSHAELDKDYGRDALPFVYQGITTAMIGVDGGGTPDISDMYGRFLDNGIGINALACVGHGAIRRQVMGMDNRAPTARELQTMKNLVKQAMQQGAIGLSTGLFYTPGFYAKTEEVIDLAKIAADFGGLYDTHDRDLGASYKGIGYLNSIREAIRIGEESGARVIFSHFNAQGAHNYGRAVEGARLIDEARARGVRVEAAQHVYTATQSNLRAYTIPRWAAAGGREAMIRRFDDPDTVKMLDVQTMEMLEIRGGPGKILFADPRPDLNGKTLAQIAQGWNLPVPETVRRILRQSNAVVMNLDLYDIENTRFLAKQPWMMTCTDGRTPAPGQDVCHPRVYGAFTRKLRQFVLDEKIITLPFAIRSMTGLAADFLEIKTRGYLREGMVADIAVFDENHIQDRATFEKPHNFSEGTVHVLVNGEFVLKNEKPTGILAGVPLLRNGGIYKSQNGGSPEN
ncbi:MAG: amidohydrolase family protein [bacterium]